MKMRNAVNNALKKTKFDIIVVTVTKTQRDNNIFFGNSYSTQHSL